MELDIRELAKWYPKPLIAFENGRVTWLNHCAGFLADSTDTAGRTDSAGRTGRADTLDRLLGETAAASLAEALKNADAARPCAWQSDAPALGAGARARLIYIAGAPYIELTVSADDTPPAHSVPPETNMVSAVLSNLGELMTDPLSIMHLALLDLDDELEKYFCGLRDGPHYMLNLTPENLGSAKSLPLTLARLYRNWSRLTLLAHTQTAFADFTGVPADKTDSSSADSSDNSDNPPDVGGSTGLFVCDARLLLDDLILQVNAMLPKGTRFRLDSDAARMGCGVSGDVLHRTAAALMAAAAADAASDSRGEAVIPFILNHSGGGVRMSVPVSDARRVQTMSGGICRRSAGSASDMSVWLSLALIRRNIGHYGGRVLFTAGGEKTLLTVTLPQADISRLEDSPVMDATQNNRVYLSAALDNTAFFPEWGL